MPNCEACFLSSASGDYASVRCTDYPFAVPVWIVPAGNSSFSVQLPTARNWVDGREIYRGSVDDAVRKADEALTDDERVYLGNAESLGL